MAVTPLDTALAAGRLIASGELSSQDLVRASIERIEARESVVHAWAHFDPDLALSQARARDSQEPKSSLHGVPVGIKDSFDTADLPAECGSPIYSGRRPSHDAVAVKKLRDAGLIVMGKTVTTELAAREPGPTANPWNPDHTPGGSSSGSAAAVADKMVSLALGSQTVGSTIRPAAYCGVWGLKPTLGLIDSHGVKHHSAWLDTLGLFARDPEDIRALTSILADGRVTARRELDAPPRIALVRTPWWDRTDASGRQAISDSKRISTDSGAKVEEIDLPLLDDLLQASITIAEYDRGWSFALEYDEHFEQLSEHLRTAIAAGQKISIDDYRRAIRLAEEAKMQMQEFLAEWDVILTPAASGEAPVGLDWTGDPLFCRVWTLLGLPTVAVPGCRGQEGMPVGLQLVGRRLGEGSLLDIATWLHARIQ